MLIIKKIRQKICQKFAKKIYQNFFLKIRQKDLIKKLRQTKFIKWILKKNRQIKKVNKFVKRFVKKMCQKSKNDIGHLSRNLKARQGTLLVG